MITSKFLIVSGLLKFFIRIHINISLFNVFVVYLYISPYDPISFVCMFFFRFAFLPHCGVMLQLCGI